MCGSRICIQTMPCSLQRSHAFCLRSALRHRPPHAVYHAPPSVQPYNKAGAPCKPEIAVGLAKWVLVFPLGLVILFLSPDVLGGARQQSPERRWVRFACVSARQCFQRVLLALCFVLVSYSVWLQRVVCRCCVACSVLFLLRLLRFDGVQFLCIVVLLLGFSCAYVASLREVYLRSCVPRLR